MLNYYTKSRNKDKKTLKNEKIKYYSNNLFFMNKASSALFVAYIIFSSLFYSRYILPEMAKKYGVFAGVITMVILLIFGLISLTILAFLWKIICMHTKVNCIYCGFENRGDSLFCKRCLCKIESGSYDEVSVVCPKCLKVKNISEPVCAKCGYKFMEYKKIWKKYNINYKKQSSRGR
jgi:hypothetical protein